MDVTSPCLGRAFASQSPNTERPATNFAWVPTSVYLDWGPWMLVLSRKTGERISIGEEIELTVLGIHRGRVKLGFSGPLDVPIHREEIVRRVGPHQETAIPSEEE